jgi:acetolactate synthase-1/2/3 large subunit
MADKEMTTAAIILDTLVQAGITHLFVNLGSDHPAFLKAFKQSPLNVITCPNEMNALSAASGFAQISSGQLMAAVLVHVECGTQALAGAVHNVSKGRIPVLIMAGTVPITMDGELVGSRNEYIHWIQDVPDQRGIVRQYMKYDHEIRTGHNARQIVLRARQLAMSEPKGPVYLIAARETLEQIVPPPAIPPNIERWGPVEPSALPPKAVERIAHALVGARAPLIVTSYLGRSPTAFNLLVQLVDKLGIAVHESAPIYNNFPTTHPSHQGHTWNGGRQLLALAEADFILIIDSDVPWIPSESRPMDPHKGVFHIDSDPLKSGNTVWWIEAEARYCADSAVALAQILASRAVQEVTDSEAIIRRRVKLRKRSRDRQTHLQQAAKIPWKAHFYKNSLSELFLTAPYIVSVLRTLLPKKYVALNESTTNLASVADHLRHDRPLSLIGSGGGALGWFSGAAVGMSLALKQMKGKDDTFVVAFTGDGTWLFGVPSSAYWMARKYKTPYLTIIWNNRGRAAVTFSLFSSLIYFLTGWKSPKSAFNRLHGGKQQPLGGDHGVSLTNEDLGVSLDPSPEFGKIAEAAGGAWWARLSAGEGISTSETKGDSDPEPSGKNFDSDVRKTLVEAIRQVREERKCAVVEVVLEQL